MWGGPSFLPGAGYVTLAESLRTSVGHNTSLCDRRSTQIHVLSTQTLCVRYCSLSNMTPTLCVNWSIMTPTPVCHQQVSSLPLSPNHCTPSAESRCVNEHLPRDEQHLPDDEQHNHGDEQHLPGDQ